MNTFPAMPMFNSQAIAMCRGMARRGIVLFTTVVGLLAASVIVMSLLQAAMSHFREVRAQRQHLQAEQLVNAGIERALAQLRASSDYRGETWQVSPDETDGSTPAEVVIQVKVPEEQSDQKQMRIFVQADYPPAEFYRVRKSREVAVATNSEGSVP